jgi:hypothetical protein
MLNEVGDSGLELRALLCYVLILSNEGLLNYVLLY